MPSVVPNTLEDSINVKYHYRFFVCVLFLHLFFEISNESQRTKRDFRYLSMHQNPLADLFKHRLLGAITRVSNSLSVRYGPWNML